MMNSKKTKSKQKIKKFRTSYILFTLDRRVELKKVYPQMTNPELIKIIANEWQKLDEETRQKYKQLEQVDMQRFQKDKEVIGNYKYKTNPKNKKPLRFRTSYMFYLSHHKGLLNSKDKYQNIELIKSLSRKWKNMTNVEKKPYEDLAFNDKDRYKNEWEKYLVECFTVKDKVKKKKEKIQLIITTLFKACSSKYEFQNQLINIFENVTEEKIKKDAFNDPEEQDAIEGLDFDRQQIYNKNLIFEVNKIKHINKEEDNSSNIKSEEKDDMLMDEDFNFNEESTKKRNYFFNLDDAVDAHISDFKINPDKHFNPDDINRFTEKIIKTKKKVKVNEEDEEENLGSNFIEDMNDKKTLRKKRERMPQKNKNEINTNNNIYNSNNRKIHKNNTKQRKYQYDNSDSDYLVDSESLDRSYHEEKPTKEKKIKIFTKLKNK